MAAALPAPVNIRRHVIVDSREKDALHPQHLEQGSCAIHSSMTIFFDLCSNAAFFKLQSPVVLLVPSSQTDHYDTVRSNVHLCIRPEQIVSLVYDRQQLPERLAPLYKKIAGQETIRLHFTLSKPAEWIVPNFRSLVPKTHEDARLLGAFQRLAKVQSMAIYMPSNAISDAKASSLCEAASTSGQLDSSPHHADFQRWYSSPGGKVVPPDDIADAVAADRPTESPPSYDDLGLSPPDPHDASVSRKRARTSSGGHEKPLDVHKAVVPIDKAGQMADRLRDLVLQAEKKEALLKERIDDADQRLVRLAEATAEDKESQLEGLKQYVDDRLEETRLEIREFIDERFDDIGVDVVLKSEMEDYVDEALRAAEDDLQARLSGSGVRVILDD
ncbi:hypothetical protein INS49_004407 [Diaporthe citri]|uniref:uncharacterized protein n=1 Tax=Diaporthe citri TaxID=83186 RepID=UPI001C7E913C|nr:uncharacterized protein INS49_004407 [Diaporthe citri]KAG6354390.1 hypothetical protein INS49_004407 [Diaporthe citri]